MFSRYDELELLALIEGDLDPAGKDAVQRRLAADPEAARVVEGMVRDRDLLRAEQEPVMPIDLSQRVEQALTRPMLIAAWGNEEFEAPPVVTTQPGQFRRHQTRAHRVRRLVPLAMAASVGLLLLGGLWLGIQTALNVLPGSDRMIAEAEPRSDKALDGQRLAAQHLDPWPPAEASIHHYAPSPVLEGRLARRGDGSVPLTADEAEPLTVEFALVIRGNNPQAAEAGIEELITTRALAAALVQNFDYDKALRAEKDWLAARGDSNRQVGPPHRNGGTPAAQHQPQTRVLAGLREVAPPIEQQIEYANRGATHTITIRFSELQAFLEELDRSDLAEESSLKPLTSRDGEESFGDLWAGSFAAVRRALAEIEVAGDDPLIHLPIVIERR